MFDKLAVDSIAARVVLVPMLSPWRTAAGDVPAAPLVLVDVQQWHLPSPGKPTVLAGSDAASAALEWDENAMHQYAFQ